MKQLFDAIEPKRIPLLAVAVLAIVAAALGSYAILPQYRARSAALAERAAVEQELRAGGASVAQMAELQAAIERLERRRDADAQRLPPPALQTRLMARLHEAARRRELVLETMLPALGKPIGGVRETLVQIELTGRFSGVRGWLGDLPSAVGPIVVRELVLAPAEAAGADPLLRVSLVLAAFGSAG